MQRWRLLDNGPADAYRNMAIDEALLLAQAQDKTKLPTLRFYGWQPAAVSLGYSQKVDEVVNKTACRQAGIDIVRRLTGGRAVYHHQELTYSLTVRDDNPLFAPSIRESYATIGQGLLAGLELLGVKPQLASFHKQQPGSGAKRSKLCFLAPSWYEIMVGGKKLVGSAQRRWKGVILQQGSLPLRVENSFFDYCQLPVIQRASLQVQWREKTIALWDLVKPLPLTEVKQALIKGFEQALGVKLVPDELSSEEIQLTRSLLPKYRLPEGEWKGIVKCEIQNGGLAAC